MHRPHTYMAATPNMHNRDVLKNISDIIERAAGEIEGLGKRSDQAEVRP